MCASGLSIGDNVKLNEMSLRDSSAALNTKHDMQEILKVFVFDSRQKKKPSTHSFQSLHLKLAGHIFILSCFFFPPKTSENVKI